MSLEIGRVEALQEGGGKAVGTSPADEPVFLYHPSAARQSVKEVFCAGIMNGLVIAGATIELIARALGGWFGSGNTWCHQAHELVVAVGCEGIADVYPVACSQMLHMGDVASDVESFLLLFGLQDGYLILGIYSSVAQLPALLLHHQLLGLGGKVCTLTHIAQSGLGTADCE